MKKLINFLVAKAKTLYSKLKELGRELLIILFTPYVPLPKTDDNIVVAFVVDTIHFGAYLFNKVRALVVCPIVFIIYECSIRPAFERMKFGI